MNVSALYFGPLVGDNGTCPDRIRIYISGTRYSIYRHPGEGGQVFWERFLTTAIKNAKLRDPQRSYLGSVSPTVHCDYDVPYLTVKAAAKADNLWNYRKSLDGLMRDAPSPSARLKATFLMCDALWPEVRKQLH